MEKETFEQIIAILESKDADARKLAAGNVMPQYNRGKAAAYNDVLVLLLQPAEQTRKQYERILAQE